MQRKSNFISLDLSSYNNAYIIHNKYRQNTFMNQKYLQLNTKKKNIFDNIQNNQIQKEIYDMNKKLENKNLEILLNNQNKFRTFNKEEQILRNNKIALNEVNRKKNPGLKWNNNANYKIINGHQNEIKNYDNMTMIRKNRNNHSFLESKYILKNEDSFFANCNQKNSKNEEISIDINDENINLSNILTKKNLNNNNLNLNINKSNNNKNNLINETSIKKSQTTFIPISRKNPNSILTINYPSIEINKKEHKVIKIINQDIKRNNKNFNKEIDYEEEIKFFNKNNTNNDRNNANNHAKNIIRMNTDINEKAKENELKIIKINGQINPKFKHLSVSPNSKRKNSIFNKYISLNEISNIENNNKIRLNTENTSSINSNNDKQYISIPKKNFSSSNVNQLLFNQVETINNNNIRNQNSLNSIPTRRRKINTREKTSLITSKRYELDSKNIDLNKKIPKNNSKKDLSNIPKKTFVKKTSQKFNYIKSCSFISISGENDEGHKKLNQDTFIIKRNINGILNFNIFGVLDGHGEHGHYVSQFVSRFIFNSIKNNPTIKKCTSTEEIYEKIIPNNYKLIENIFLDADMQIRKEKFDYRTSGTTCIIIIQLNQKIICANVGDSRAIIVHNKGKNLLKESEIFPLSQDFKPDLPEERKRIYECGGVVEKAPDDNDEEDGPYRVYMRGEDFPGLAMSRSIGDIDSKNIGVIPNPQFIEYNINEETKYMIVCSDGIWEFMSNEKVMEIANKYYLDSDSKGLCQCLYETSVKYWNEAHCFLDDITAVAVFF